MASCLREWQGNVSYIFHETALKLKKKKRENAENVGDLNAWKILQKEEGGKYKWYIANLWNKVYGNACIRIKKSVVAILIPVHFIFQIEMTAKSCIYKLKDSNLCNYMYINVRV